MTGKDTTRQPDKDDHDVNVIRIGGSLYAAIPPSLAEYLEIEEGSTLKMQREYSDIYREYGSFWNPDQQEKQEQPAEAQTSAQ